MPETVSSLATGDVGQSLNRPYIAPVDYLRALAAMTVVLYHGLIAFRVYTHQGPWQFENWPRLWNPIGAYMVEGHTAVALFMVLSGYVLTKGVVSQDVNYGRFIRNRALRIYPLYIFLLMLSISMHPSTFTLTAFVQTLLPFANEPGYLQSEVFTALFWTVAVEFQFYLIFPFLNKFIARSGVRYVFYAILMMCVFNSLSFFYHVDQNDLAYRTIFGRLSQFLLGMAAAYLPPRAWMRHRLTLPASFVAMFAAMVLFNHHGGYPAHRWWKLYWPVPEGMMWTTIVLASVHAPYRMPSLCRLVIRQIANMSFSLYLLHSIIYQIIGERRWYVHPLHSVYGNAFINALIALPFTLLLAQTTYQLIEKPFMSIRVRYAVS